MRYGMRVGSAIVALAVLAVVCLGPRPALADPSTDPCGSIQVQPDGTIDAAPLIGWLQSNYPDMSLDAVLQIVGDTLSLCSVSNPALAGSIQGGDSGLVVPVVTGPVTPPPGIALGTGCGDSGEASCQPYVPVMTQVTNGIYTRPNGGAIQIGSVTVPFNNGGAGAFQTMMAVAVAAAPGLLSNDCQGLLQNPSQFQLTYNGSHWPASVQGQTFDYPQGPDFLQELDQDGWLGAGPFDLSDAPPATSPGDVWNRQPTGGQVSQLSAYPALASVYLPGVLYVNTSLQWDPNEGAWHVTEWNYNFAVNADFVGKAGSLNCQPTPPQQQLCPPGTTDAGQPVPSDGNCNPICPKVKGEQPNPDGTCPGGEPPQACPDGSPPTANGWCGGQVYIPVCPPGTAKWGDPVPPDGNCNPGTPIGPFNPKEPPPPPPQLHVLLDCGDYIPCENRNVPGPPGLPTWTTRAGVDVLPTADAGGFPGHTT